MNREFFSTLIWVSFGISIFTFAFSNGEKTLTNALLTLGITVMYTLVIGVGNGFVNDFLSRKFSWVEQTRTRVIYGIIGTVLVNVILVFLCNYINFIVIQGNDPTKFLSGNMGISNWITVNISLLVSAILHAKSFMEEWKNLRKKR